MNWLTQLSLILLSAFLLWRLYHYYQQDPSMFSKANWSKSFFTMGILALILIGVIALSVMFLRMG